MAASVFGRLGNLKGNRDLAFAVLQYPEKRLLRVERQVLTPSSTPASSYPGSAEVSHQHALAAGDLEPDDVASGENSPSEPQAPPEGIDYHENKMRTSRVVKEGHAVPDLDVMTDSVFAAIHDGRHVLRESDLPLRDAEDWCAVRLALEKMPMEVVVELCKLKGTFTITRMLARGA